MIKTHCVKCSKPLPKAKKHYEVYGNFCTECSGNCGYKRDHIRKKPTVPLTPLEIELLRRDVELSIKVEKEIPQISDYEYNRLRGKVEQEMRDGMIEKAGNIILTSTGETHTYMPDPSLTTEGETVSNTHYE